MNNINVVALVIKSYQSLIKNKNLIDLSNRERSSKFINTLADEIFIYLNNDSVKIGVLAQGRENEIEIFKRTELLFDINAYQYSFINSFKRGQPIPYIVQSLVQLESEFAENTFEVVTDLNKLVCGNAQLKIMVISFNSSIDTFLESLIPIVKNIREDLYIVILLHPSDWIKSSASQTYAVYRFENLHFNKITLT